MKVKITVKIRILLSNMRIFNSIHLIILLTQRQTVQGKIDGSVAAITVLYLVIQCGHDTRANHNTANSSYGLTQESESTISQQCKSFSFEDTIIYRKFNMLCEVWEGLFVMIYDNNCFSFCYHTHKERNYAVYFC